MSELKLRQDVLDELEFEPSVNAAQIGVAADRGIVTLSGYVSTYAEKLAAVAAARRVKGVRALADEINVRYPLDKKTTDDEIARRAIDILAWDTIVPSGCIQVTVRDGWVTLTGNVNWFYQKKSAEDDVRKLSGVNGVNNDIQIKPCAQSGDVKRKIEDALKRHAEIEAGSIRVTVQGNKVILEGKVDSFAEVTAAEIAAWSAAGVTSVENHLIFS